MGLKPFFAPTELTQIKEPMGLLPKCGACGLYKGCKSPKMPVSGNGRKKILILAEAPGKNEDDQNLQLVGDSGQLLERLLDKYDINMRDDCWLTNSLICRPPDNNIKDDNWIDYCRPNLVKTLNELQPEVILMFGYYSVKSLIGWLWKEDVGNSLMRWIGWQIPSQQINAWLCPMFHPAYPLWKKNEVAERVLENHIRNAARLQGRPWKRVPNYISQVIRLHNPTQAARRIRMWTNSDRPVAFDFETNMLKPDNPKGYIVSCSISDGQETIAYPWVGEAIQATKELLTSPVPKIGHNLKYEDRWCMAKLGIRVRNWAWDGMVAAHVIDNRPDITSLKFQSFVLLGQADWDSHVKPYLKPKTGGGGNAPNRIKEVGLDDLLLYNGMDSLMTWKIAQIQMDQLKI
jgi:uracil-DNA glycosylase family 4